MSKELEKFLQISNEKNVSDEDTILAILDGFCALTANKAKRRDKANQDDMIDIAKSFFDFDITLSQDMTIGEFISAMNHTSDTPAFDTKRGFRIDREIYPNYIAFCVAMELLANRERLAIVRFMSINMAQYLKVMFKNFENGRGAEERRSLYKNIADGLNLESVYMPQPEDTLGSMLTKLVNVGRKPWKPGVEDIRKYEDRITASNSAIFQIMILLPYQGYIKKECGSTLIDEIYEKYCDQSSWDFMMDEAQEVFQ